MLLSRVYLHGSMKVLHDSIVSFAVCKYDRLELPGRRGIMQVFARPVPGFMGTPCPQMFAGVRLGWRKQKKEVIGILTAVIRTVIQGLTAPREYQEPDPTLILIGAPHNEQGRSQCLVSTLYVAVLSGSSGLVSWCHFWPSA